MTYKKIYTMLYKLNYSKKLKKRRKMIACLAFFYAMIYYLNPDLYFLYWGPWDNTTCHYIESDDVTLPRADGVDFNPPAKSIFFHETSCRGQLNSRQACAVESAARAHPDWQINVLFCAPVTHYALKTRAIAIIKNITNIKLTRIHIVKYANGTPLEYLVSGGALNRTRWRISHSSDVLRYLSLYKFGGVYLDLDVVVVKPFDSLTRNWAARETNTSVAAGALAFSRDNIGRDVADAVIRSVFNCVIIFFEQQRPASNSWREMKSKFRGDMWGHNGPGVITRVLTERCHGVKPANMSVATCNGFEVYAPQFFYPIHYLNASRYFKPGDIDEEIPYVFHVWNARTSNLKVHADSPYAKLARKYCPNVYKLYENDFGV